MELGAQLQGIVIEDGIAVEDVAVSVVAVAPAGGVPGGEMLIAGLVHGVAGFMPQLYAAFSQAVAVPVDGSAGFLAEEAYQILVEMAGRILGGHGNVVELVDFRPPFLLVAGVDRAQVVADPDAGLETVDADDLCALLRGGRDGKHAAGTAADDKDLGLIRSGDIAVGDLRFGAEPVAAVLCRTAAFIGNGSDDFHGDLSLCLGDALGGSLGYGRAGNVAGAGHGVKLGALGGQDGVTEGSGHRFPVGDGRRVFPGYVDDGVGDVFFVKGHGDGNRAVFAVGLPLVCTGDIQAACRGGRGSGCGLGSRCGGSALRGGRGRVRGAGACAEDPGGGYGSRPGQGAL